MNLIIVCLFINAVNGVPLRFVQKVAENDQFEKFENYMPKIGDLPKYHYSTFGENRDSNELLRNEINFRSHEDVRSKEKPKTLGDVMDFVKDGLSAGMEIFSEVNDLFSTSGPETTTLSIEENTTEFEETTTNEPTTISYSELDPLFDDYVKNNSSRAVRQQGGNNRTINNDVELTGDSESTTAKKESQESTDDGEEEEEPPQDMITGLISAFLGGLSRPDGSIDVEAIAALVGSLYTQNEDGTYNFDGLTDLLMSFLGGGEEGGGSDIGAFLAAITGSLLKGIADPPGAKGIGSLFGKLLGGILPAILAPAPAQEGQKPGPPLDSGGFLAGLLHSFFGTSGNFSNMAYPKPTHEGGGSKFSIFKAIFSIITSLFSSSSHPHEDWH